MKFFCKFLFFLNLSFFVFLPVMTFADDNTFLIDFSNTPEQSVVSDFILDWLDTDNTNYTYSDFADDLADMYINLHFGVVGDLASSLHDSVKSLLWNYAFSLNTTNGFVSAPVEFSHDLEELYIRLGFSSSDSYIGHWYSLPRYILQANGYGALFSSSSEVYMTTINGQGAYFAVRGSSSNVDVLRWWGNPPVEGSGTPVALQLRSFYQGVKYSGYYYGSYSLPSGGSSSLPSDAVYSSVSLALSDFFGDINPSGGLLWNGNLYYDFTPKTFSINNVVGNQGLNSSQNRYVILKSLGKSDNDDISPYFNNDVNIIYRPNYSDIPNNHNFEPVVYPSGVAPDLSFEFEYTIAEDSNGFMSVLDSSMVGIIGTIVTIGAIFLLLGVIL